MMAIVCLPLDPVDRRIPAATVSAVNALALGTGLGLLNVAFIALGISFAYNDPDLRVAMFVLVFGILPGGLTGAILGLLAHASRAHPRWFRLPILIVPAVLVVFALGGEFDMLRFVPLAAIPTVIAALQLERRTRATFPPPVPLARAL
jgi:hypothetical protein